MRRDGTCGATKESLRGTRQANYVRGMFERLNDS